MKRKKWKGKGKKRKEKVCEEGLTASFGKWAVGASNGT